MNKETLMIHKVMLTEIFEHWRRTMRKKMVKKTRFMQRGQF